MPWFQVALTLEVGYRFKIELGFGYDASGIQELFADGVKGPGRFGMLGWGLGCRLLQVDV
jgi:hypothetical protein